METTNTYSNTIAIPSKELFELAKTKGANLGVNEQIYLTAQEHTYIIVNMGGKVYIGRDVNSKCRQFFKTREVLDMKNRGEVVGYYQAL